MISIKIATSFMKISVLYTKSIFEMCSMLILRWFGGLQNGKSKHQYYNS